VVAGKRHIRALKAKSVSMISANLRVVTSFRQVTKEGPVIVQPPPALRLRPTQLAALLVWAALVVVFEAYDLVAYGTTLPQLRVEWGMSEGVAGLLGALAPVGMMIGALMAGGLTNRFGKLPVILVGLIWFSLFTSMTAVATGPPMFGALRLVAGVGMGAVLPPLYALVHEVAPRRHQALTLVMAQVGFSVGGLVAASVAIWMIPRWGWRGMYILGALPLVTLVPWGLMMRREPLPSKLTAPRSSELGHETPRRQADVREMLAPGLRSATTLLWAMSICGLLLIFGLNTWLPAVMLKSGYPIGSALFFLTILNVGAVVGCVVGGLVVDRWNVPRSVAVSFALFAVAMTVLTGVRDDLVVHILLAIAGYGAIGAFAMVNVQVARTYPPRLRPSGLGWSLGIGRIGAVAGPALAGLILASGGANQSLLFFAIVAVIGCAAALLAARKRPF
jgi:MFS transporter, AAHS family, benzoate transport protein